MSRKTQQGAAQHAEQGPEEGTGWFGRLRRQPGFRTAAVAFLLTVVLGLGGTAAYAYWSASTAANISVTPTIRLGTPSGLACEWSSDPNRIYWNAVPDTAVDSDVVYLLTFTQGSRTKSYAVPRGTTSAQPAKLPNLQEALGQTQLERRALTVTLQTAIVRQPVGRHPVESGANDVVVASPTASTLQMYYYTSLWANYPCGRN